MSAQWGDDGEWEVAVDKKKISREYRRERKEAAAAAAALAGVDAEDFEAVDAASRRAMAAASFYGSTTQAGKRKVGQGKKAASVDEEEVWIGGGPNPKAKKSKSKSSKAALPSYSTGDELAAALHSIVSNQPPSSLGTVTIASLGDKLQTLTRCAWNKRYKSEFGSLRAFLEARPEFCLQGDEVTLAPAGGKKAKKASAGSSGSASGAKGSKKAASSQKEAESEDEEQDEESDEEETEAASKRARKAGSKQQSSSGGGVCSVGTVVALLVLGIAGTGFLYLSQLQQGKQ